MKGDMPMKTIAAIVMLFGITVAPYGEATAQKKQTASGEMAQNGFVLLPVNELQWQPFGEEFPGVDFALAQGDPSQGAYAMYVRLPAGMMIPLHYHGNDEWGVVISGTVIVGLENGRQTTLGPGSYIFSPKGVRHTTTAGPEGCVFLEVSNEKESTFMVESPERK